MADIKALAVLRIDSFREVAGKLSRLKGWNLNTLKDGLKLIPMVVKEVEKLGEARNLDGHEKQQLAVEIILKLVKLPWWLPVSFAKPLLEAAVDAIVEAYNSRFDK